MIDIEKKKKIVMIAGAMESGKDTLAEVLASEFGFGKLYCSTELKRAVSEIFEFPMIWTYSREGKEKRLPLAGGKTVRETLQLFGTNVCRHIYSNVWIDKLLRIIEDAQTLPRIVIPDCRFENEATSIWKKYPDASLIYLTRDIHLDSHGSEDFSWIKHYAPIVIDTATQTVEESKEEIRQWVSQLISPCP